MGWTSAGRQARSPLPQLGRLIPRTNPENTMNTVTQSPTMKTAALKFYSRSGLEIRPIARAAGSDGDSIWARRVGDGALRCYFLHDVRSEGGAVEISDYATTLPTLDKAQSAGE